jgi:hypothetical protein
VHTSIGHRPLIPFLIWEYVGVLKTDTRREETKKKNFGGNEPRARKSSEVMEPIRGKNLLFRTFFPTLRGRNTERLKPASGSPTPGVFDRIRRLNSREWLKIMNEPPIKLGEEKIICI